MCIRDRIKPIAGVVQPPETSISTTLRTTSGRTLEASETEFSLKSTSKQLAVEKNAFESWLIDNGNITEGSASNAWIIKSSNTIITHPANTEILKGVTRTLLIKIINSLDYKFIEKYHFDFIVFMGRVESTYLDKIDKLK